MTRLKGRPVQAGRLSGAGGRVAAVVRPATPGPHFARYRGDAGVHHRLAGQRHELLALGGRGPGHALLRVHGCPDDR